MISLAENDIISTIRYLVAKKLSTARAVESFLLYRKALWISYTTKKHFVVIKSYEEIVK